MSARPPSAAPHDHDHAHHGHGVGHGHASGHDDSAPGRGAGDRHRPAGAAGGGGRAVRREIDHRRGAPAGPAGAPDAPGPWSATRRGALGFAAASAALALAGCDATDEWGQPLYARGRGAPEAASYATVLDLDGVGRGVLARTRRGHVVKVEGNPDHPASLGATDAFAEAAVLSLHDPGRSRRVREDGRPRAPAALDEALAGARDALLPRGGEGLRIVTGPIASPTLERLIGEVLAAFPAARWHRHAPLAADAARAGALAAFGREVSLRPDLARARAVLCLGADPLGAGPAQIRWARDWSEGRARGREAGRLPWLGAVELAPGLTGARADLRLALPPREMAVLARAVASALSVPGLAGTAAHPEAAAIAARLREAGPEALVLAGADAPAKLHALAHAANAALGAAGTTMRFGPPVLAGEGAAGESMRELAGALSAGSVTHLLVLDADPAGEAPAALGLRAAIRRAGFSLHLGAFLDETAHLCRWHAPLPHALEAWGDSRAFDGTEAIRQPAALGQDNDQRRDAASVLLALLGREGSARDAVRDTWAARWAASGPASGDAPPGDAPPGDAPSGDAPSGGVPSGGVLSGEAFEARWEAALERGVAADAPADLPPPAIRADWDGSRDSGGAASPGQVTGEAPGALVARFAPDPAARAGEWAGNAWLRELPDAVTGLAWGNAALMAPATAAALSLREGAEVELALEGRRVVAPLLVLPGHAPGVVTLPLGGGRRAGAEAGIGLGFDAALLRPAGGETLAPGLSVRPTGRSAALMRPAPILGQPDAPKRLAPGEALPVAPPDASLLGEWRATGAGATASATAGAGAGGIAGTGAAPGPGPDPGPGPAWAMAIDLDACIGCNACAVACQAENNVPVVGPEASQFGRAMHWLRIDRDRTAEAPGAPDHHRPVPCMHCEQAPCEPACPVHATVHDQQGLNVMVHARCIGTRTCANACPYGVRRFNWDDHRAATATPGRNPDVALRPRGVMEKCTYCSHRIAAARADADAGGREAEVATACQSACPTRAIAFGDLRDPGSAVSRARRDGRHYLPLGELGTRPRTTYLARVGAAPRSGGGA